MSLLNLFQIDERKTTGSDGGREWREQSYAGINYALQAGGRQSQPL